MLVNGAELIDIVREVELPHALREYDERLATGEAAKELGVRGALAGQYHYPTRKQIYLPSTNLRSS